MQKNNFRLSVAIILLLASCGGAKDELLPPSSGSTEIVVSTSKILHNNFSGNGAQWGGYDYINYYTQSKKLSAQDWSKLTSRIDFMRPGIVRIMGSQGWNYSSTGDYSASENVLVPILDYCQSKGITVIFGEWGHQGGANSVDETWLGRAVDYLNWLVNTKGYSCIKYYVMVNEPNGESWSSTEGNYSIWQIIIEKLYVKMQAKNLLGKVKIMGPDVAFWSQQSAVFYRPWMNYTVQNLAEKVQVYDIHAYPGQKYTRSGDFTAPLLDYRQIIPEGRDIYMTELGGKYPDEPDLSSENQRRKTEMPFTGDDSNMFIYDASYGIDMADAIIQCMNAKYAGAIVWDMDDAMYCQNSSGGAPNALKRWGFWNIMGSEIMGGTVGANDENIRPWFYTISLLCRFFPQGSKIFTVTTPDSRLKAVAAEKNGKYSIAIVNSSYSKFAELKLKFDISLTMTNAKIYQFSARIGKEYIATIDANGLASPLKTESSIDFKQGYTLPEVTGLTFTLVTNME